LFITLSQHNVSHVYYVMTKYDIASLIRYCKIRYPTFITLTEILMSIRIISSRLECGTVL